ncbi:MAG: AsnC family transcriptional regulator [Candidatus Heimdallarchaeota archaeon]|nr:AsnC family transcriptional regulator [Candidatus Heimdallarchaeota archaeon]
MKFSNLLDEKSLEMIRLLSENGRSTFVELGKLLNLSHVAIRNRYKNLEENQLVQIRAEVNSKKIPLELVLFLIESSPKVSRKELFETYSSCPRVIFCASLIGEYDFMVLAYSENRETLESLMSTRFLKEEAGVRHSSTFILGSYLFPSFLPINVPNSDTDEYLTPCKLNCNECSKYKDKLCIGCPETKWYKL